MTDTIIQAITSIPAHKPESCDDEFIFTGTFDDRILEVIQTLEVTRHRPSADYPTLTTEQHLRAARTDHRPLTIDR